MIDMDDELMESYVKYGIKSSRFLKSTCFAMLLINIPLAVIALNMYSDTALIGVVASTLILNVITAFIFYAKWSVISGFLSQATQGICLTIIYDCFTLSLYKMLNAFVWSDYAVTIALQIIAVPFVLIIVILSARKHDKNKVPKVLKIGLSAGTSIYAVSSIISKVFLANLSINVVIIIMNIILNVVIFLMWYVVLSAIYRAYLVKRYKLNITLDPSIL